MMNPLSPRNRFVDLKAEKRKGRWEQTQATEKTCINRGSQQQENDNLENAFRIESFVCT